MFSFNTICWRIGIGREMLNLITNREKRRETPYYNSKKILANRKHSITSNVYAKNNTVYLGVNYYVCVHFFLYEKAKSSVPEK